MGKYPKTVGSILDRDRVWAYQEIMAEALIVMWFSLHITLKFGTRFFPEWRNTRVDPEVQTDLDNLLARLGYADVWHAGSGGCFSDRESSGDKAKHTALFPECSRFYVLPIKFATSSIWLFAVLINTVPVKFALPSADSLGHAWKSWKRYYSAYAGTGAGGTYCVNYRTGMEYPQAILSHWMDLGYPQWRTRHPALLSLFSTDYSSLSSGFLREWIRSQFLLNAIPLIIIFSIMSIVLWPYMRCDAGEDHSSASTPGGSEAGSGAKLLEAVGSDDDDFHLDLDGECFATFTVVPVENTSDGPGKHHDCACSWSAGIVAILVVLIKRFMCWIFLPYPLVQLLVPEPLQLLALMLLLTAYGAWIYWKLLHNILQFHKETYTGTPTNSQPWWTDIMS
ncbi:uncharacterized protein LOC129596328 [Paramacrobiotus metropolitanus]|uniref:uncharacterized protein LOC129596328 n=1 Tax=Paramacrobiotus metropolitanus TaxID=2943436 RepID=UPI002445FEAD|nr:uncharacterized protein LOC129596328 [Paramacrobiotus metropolitanus]